MSNAGLSEMIGGIVLAGGQSSRMGCNKALLPYEGRRLVDHAFSILTETGLAPVAVSGFVSGLPSFLDCLPPSGPMSGICTVFALPWDLLPRGWLFLPIDMPLVNPPLLKKLVNTPPEHDAACFTSGPLPLLLRNNEGVRKRIEIAFGCLRRSGSLAIKEFIKPLSVFSLAPGAAELPLLSNINTPQDWQKVITG